MHFLLCDQSFHENGLVLWRLQTSTENRGFFVSAVEKTRGFLDPREQFSPRQFRAGRLENAAYMQWVAYSIQG